jgi:hypothetical protein
MYRNRASWGNEIIDTITQSAAEQHQQQQDGVSEG